MNYWVIWLSVFSDDFFDSLFRFNIALMVPLYEYIPDVRSFYWLFGNLNFSPGFLLQLPDRLSTLANNQSHDVIGHRDDIGIVRWGTVWSHHGLIQHLVRACNSLDR